MVFFFKGLYILCRGLNDIDVVHGDENESNVAVFLCVDVRVTCCVLV